MSESNTRSNECPPRPKSHWVLAFALTTLVTAAGFVVALQQFIAKFLWDESLHTRTIGGALYMSLGLAGLYLPLRLLGKRSHFAQLSSARQWLNTLGVPVLYVLAFVACVEASMRSTNVILPRPFTPIVVVTYNASLPRIHKHRTGIEFRNAIREDHLTGGFGHRSRRDDDVERFQADYDEGFLRHDERLRMATFDGETRLLEDGRIQVSIEVDAKERLQFDVRGLDNVVITRDGKTIDRSDARSGKYEIVIVGHPAKER